jgi:hypothetical protein
MHRFHEFIQFDESVTSVRLICLAHPAAAQVEQDVSQDAASVPTRGLPT